MIACPTSVFGSLSEGPSRRIRDRQEGKNWAVKPDARARAAVKGPHHNAARTTSRLRLLKPLPNTLNSRRSRCLALHAVSRSFMNQNRLTLYKINMYPSYTWLLWGNPMRRRLLPNRSVEVFLTGMQAKKVQFHDQGARR
jgi:hypothetical protein